MDVLKRARQQAIGDLVRTSRIRTQQELVAALRDKGYRATQATVSRDITEMGLVKVDRDGGPVYALPSSEAAVELTGERRLAGLLSDLPVEIRISGTLVVIRAVPGTAHAIASRSASPNGSRSVGRATTLVWARSGGSSSNPTSPR